jgi:hypothetical protein
MPYGALFQARQAIGLVRYLPRWQQNLLAAALLAAGSVLLALVTLPESPHWHSSASSPSPGSATIHASALHRPRDRCRHCRSKMPARAATRVSARAARGTHSLRQRGMRDLPLSNPPNKGHARSHRQRHPTTNHGPAATRIREYQADPRRAQQPGPPPTQPSPTHPTHPTPNARNPYAPLDKRLSISGSAPFPQAFS